jgi:hypothetical protein
MLLEGLTRVMISQLLLMTTTSLQGHGSSDDSHDNTQGGNHLCQGRFLATLFALRFQKHDARVDKHQGSSKGSSTNTGYHSQVGELGSHECHDSQKSVGDIVEQGIASFLHLEHIQNAIAGSDKDKRVAVVRRCKQK